MGIFDKFKGDDEKKVELAEVNHFATEMDHFSDCILGDKEPRTPGEEGLADMRVLAAIDEAARSGKAIPLRGRGPQRS